MLIIGYFGVCVEYCTLRFCRIFDSVVGNLEKNFAEGTEYFKVDTHTHTHTHTHTVTHTVIN